MFRSVSRTAPRVGDVASGDRSNRRSLDRRHGRGIPVQGYELDLERLAVRVDMNDGSTSPLTRPSLGTAAVNTTRSSSLIIDSTSTMEPYGVQENHD